MRRRVIEVRQGRVIRDEVDAGYERERRPTTSPGSLFDDAFRA
jgi:hypothetical protein